jgi:hypothetical protein
MWVHGDSFIRGLKMNRYKLTPVSLDTLLPKDVLVWKNENNLVQHASYYLGSGYFFNKDGQSFFNPWQLVSIHTLYNTWSKERIEVFRQTDS